jgi:hypothetical protein
MLKEGMVKAGREGMKLVPPLLPEGMKLVPPLLPPLLPLSAAVEA